MINKPVVLILGAGASWDYGFPTGQPLKAKIWEILSNGEFKNMCGSPSTLDHFKKSLELTPDLSIDAFLEHNFDEFGEIGKKAIARVLLPFEKETNLFTAWIHRELDAHYGTNDIPPKGQHWYTYLFNVMSDGVEFNNFKNNKLTVVTFNYDRSFEWFMLKALSAKYQKPIEKSAEVLRSIPIIHIYGKLGKLPHLDKSSSDDYVEYNSWHNVDSIERQLMINRAAESIKIIHEKDCDLKNLKKSQDAFIKAQRIYFLGFGYHMTNMERLFHKIHNIVESGLEQSNENMLNRVGRNCNGTALGVSIHLKNRIRKFGLPDRPDVLFDLPIYDFLKDSPNSSLSL